MAQKNRATELLQNKHSIPEIATELGISISSVIQYLYLQVGEGDLKRSDILFSIPASDRQAIEDAIQQTGTDTNFYALEKVLNLASHPICLEIIRTYLDLRDARVSRGDMYELISEIEVTLHDFVRKILITEFGSDEYGWWRQGIPENIRASCAAAREEDPEPAQEQYCYTNFIHLQEVIDKQWSIFSKRLPPFIVKDKKFFLSGLVKINHIRNSIMHPVKRIPITEEDFSFVRMYSEVISMICLV